jgi:hypothetical protein
MKKLNQKAFSDQISEYSIKELAFCAGHIFSRILEFGDSSEDIIYLKKWCAQTIDSAVRFKKRKKNVAKPSS